jgi:fused signal recognition particle receptor
MSARWPLPTAPAPDAAELAQWGEAVVAAVGQRDAATPAAARAGQPLLDLLAQLALVLQSAAPGGVRRQTSWWGRLLGRDVERELDAQDWQPRLGVLLTQVEVATQALREQGSRYLAAQATALDAARATQRWVDAGAGQLPALPAPLQPVLAQRLDHLRRLAAVQQLEAGQWQLLFEQDNALLARSQRITETLLPAWRQALLARRADDQQQRNTQAARLQAQITAELASAQARLD